MNVTFEFFGSLQRLAGADALNLDLAGASPTVADALAELVRLRPVLAAPLEAAAVAVGDSLVQRGDAVVPGTRLALLPPVAGG